MKKHLWLLAFACSQAAAQEKQLGTVVVTSGSASDPSLTLPNIGTARKRIGTVPGGANIVDGDSYREGRVSTLDDALGYSPGVYAAPRFGAEEARLSIRGSGLQRTFHLRGIKLMQDGVPLNLADGSGDFQAVEPLQTRYIEVFRGANALQYGSSTLGGAINYVSVTGYDNWPLLVRGEAGSFGYLRSQVSGGATYRTDAGDMDWMATYSTFNQDGFRDHAVQKAQRATANAGYKLTPDLETRFYLSYANSDSQLPGNITKAQMNDNPRQANAANVAGNQKRDIDWLRLSNKTVWRVGEGRLELSAYYNDKKLFHPIFQVIDQVNGDYGGELRWVGEAQWFGRRNIFTAGYQPSRGTIRDERHVNAGGNRGALLNIYDQLASNSELYVENQHYVLERTALVLGLQHSTNRRKSQDLYVAPGEANESFDLKYSGTSPKVGLRQELSPAVQVFGNISGSYEPPSFGELAGGRFVNLNREQTATTYELGTRGTLSDFGWDAAIYYARVKDELLTTSFIPAGNSPVPSPQTSNVPRTTHAGVELGTNGRFLKSFEWRQSLFIQRFRFDNDPVFRDNTLPGLPKSFFKGEVVYRAPHGLYVGANVEWSPQRYPIDMANTFFADPYAIWGAKVGQKIDARWSWFVEGRNLSNKKYAATTGVTRTQLGLDGAQFLPGDGRAGYVGLEFKL